MPSLVSDPVVRNPVLSWSHGGGGPAGASGGPEPGGSELVAGPKGRPV